MTVLFISDLHLSPERPAITRAFFSFLETTARQAEALYILGDLVEAWIGDDDPSELSRQLVTKLRELADTGVKLYFQHGNRDFLIGKRFAKESGATLLDEYHVVDSGGKKVLLCHGDTLCTDDIDYQKFRRKVRRPLYRWFLAHLPLRKRQQIARDWRQKSRLQNSNKSSNIMDVNDRTVDEIMSKYRASIVIHGHTHRPCKHQTRRGIRYVLGDWDELGWYLEATPDGTFTLRNFQIS
jgi:UDP-2,3-diacylglucosamine hydrolase